MSDRLQFPEFIDSGTDAMHRDRTIYIVLHVFFTRPDHLHWSSNLFRNQSSLDREVSNQAPAEPAAQECALDFDPLLRELEHSRHSHLRKFLPLRRRPYLHPITRD